MIIKGNFIYAVSPKVLCSFPDSYMRIVDGKVVEITPNSTTADAEGEFLDCSDCLIIPGFTDLHVHAPQYGQAGLGMDLELLEWLEQLTFPREARFVDISFAQKAYTIFADALLRQGTLHAAIYATSHLEATRTLFDILDAKGLKGFVGKVDMDQNAPSELVMPIEAMLRDTEELAVTYAAHPRVKPIITPRFVPTCSNAMLDQLGKLAARYNLPVQSHLSENMQEIQWVKRLHPKAHNYADVYREYGLLGQTPTLMGHCIHLNIEERELLRENKVVAVHCPHSNNNLASGIMPLCSLQEEGITIGLGTDVGGGHSLSMPVTMVGAIQASKILQSITGKGKHLTLEEVFFLATKGNGAFFGQVGSFEPGFAFDALIIKDSIPACQPLSLSQRLQRFIYAGDDREIIMRFIDGKICPTG